MTNCITASSIHLFLVIATTVAVLQLDAVALA
ncbi:MAG: hypothetical protein ACI9R3_002292, partial [Verrucomicrobiales bacterium]